MGIQGYHKYIKYNIHGSYKKVNILNELKEHRRKTGRDPVLVIQLKTLWNANKLTIDDLFGLRLNKIQKKVEDFLNRLKEANVKLVFPFSKRFMERKDHEDEWAKKQEREYTDSMKALDKIEELQTVNELENFYSENNISNEFHSWFPKNASINQLLLDIAKKYGEVVGPVSSHQLQYSMTEQADLATQKEAYAVLTFESFFLIHESKWKFWSSNELDFEEMTVNEYDKNVIMNYFGLEYKHMPLFVVLTGCQLLDYNTYVRKLRRFFGPKPDFFKKVANYIKRKKYPLTDNTLWSIARDIFEGRLADSFFYEMTDILKEFRNKNATVPYDRIVEIVRSSFNNCAFEVLTGCSIYITPFFYDFRKNDLKRRHDLMLPVIQRACGVIFKHKDSPYQAFKVAMKRSHSASIAKEIVKPVYPDFEIPNIMNILRGNISDESRYEIIQWVLDLKLTEDQLRSIPPEYFFIILTLVFLYDNNSLVKAEAMGILKTLIWEKNQKIPDQIDYPDKVCSRALRVSINFVKIFKLIESCLSPCGFTDFNFDLPFDGVFYQKRFIGKNDAAKYNQDPREIFDMLLEEVSGPFTADIK